MPRLRYVQLPDHPTVAQIDAALVALRERRNATALAVVRGWVDAEIDTALEMRSAAAAGQPHDHRDMHMA